MNIFCEGFETEGIFRINGSTRIVEKYRTSFDMRGDADLNEEEDLMAVASLLKLFLREIPEALIPENKTQRFIAVQEGREIHTHLPVHISFPLISKMLSIENVYID